MDDVLGTFALRNTQGALAHGSIVAREYGIPAVMRTGVATERIKSGMLLAIDG